MELRDRLFAQALADWTAKDREAGRLALFAGTPPAVVDPGFDRQAFSEAVAEAKKALANVRLLVQEPHSG